MSEDKEIGRNVPTATNKHPLLGRPTVMTYKVEWRLEEAFTKGLNASEACALAGISRDTYYKHYRGDEGFAQRIESAKQHLTIRAKMNVAEKIEAGDTAASVWHLEKRFKDRSGFTADEGEKDTRSGREQAAELWTLIEQGKI